MKKLLLTASAALLFGTVSMAQNGNDICDGINMPQTVRTDGSDDLTRAHATLGPFGKLQKGQTFTLSIYNRWGKAIWETSDPTEAWNLKYKDEVIAEGVYFYVVEANCGGENELYKGQFTVIK